MIADHAWRPFYGGGGTNRLLRGKGPMADRPCEFMNCRRPRSEHARSVSLKHAAPAVKA